MFGLVVGNGELSWSFSLLGLPTEDSNLEALDSYCIGAHFYYLDESSRLPDASLWTFFPHPLLRHYIWRISSPFLAS